MSKENEKANTQKSWKTKIDKITLVKAIGICALGWLAVPLIYVLLKKKEKEVEEDGNGNTNIDGNTRSLDIHSK